MVLYSMVTFRGFPQYFWESSIYTYVGGIFSFSQISHIAVLQVWLAFIVRRRIVRVMADSISLFASAYDKLTPWLPALYQFVDPSQLLVKLTSNGFFDQSTEAGKS